MLFFLSVQIRWEKNITLGEPPGFLHSWWWWVSSFFQYFFLNHPPYFLFLKTVTIKAFDCISHYKDFKSWSLTCFNVVWQCFLGPVLCCSREKRHMWALQWSQGLPWLCESGYLPLLPTHLLKCFYKHSKEQFREQRQALE